MYVLKLRDHTPFSYFEGMDYPYLSCEEQVMIFGKLKYAKMYSCYEDALLDKQKYDVKDECEIIIIKE